MPYFIVLLIGLVAVERQTLISCRLLRPSHGRVIVYIFIYFVLFVFVFAVVIVVNVSRLFVFILCILSMATFCRRPLLTENLSAKV